MIEALMLTHAGDSPYGEGGESSILL